jgi:hypothetical protein
MNVLGIASLSFLGLLVAGFMAYFVYLSRAFLNPEGKERDSGGKPFDHE